MVNVLEKNYGEFSILDSAFITASKMGSELVLQKVPMVGNGTLKSGLIKLGGAIVVSMASKNKYVQYFATGLMLDGTEDVSLDLSRRFSNKQNGNSSEIIL